MGIGLQNAGRALSKITPNHVRCLAAVNRCQEFISWLRDTIKGSRVGEMSYLYGKNIFIISQKREQNRLTLCKILETCWA